LLALVNAVMGVAVDMLQSGKKLSHINNLITAG
jgi:hypothetical protein